MSFLSTRSDARVRFHSGAIFLDQSQFFVTHSNQWDCFNLYRSLITSNGFFFSCKGGAKAGQKARLSRYVEIFWNKKGFLLLYKQIDSMSPYVWYSNRSQKTSKCGKSISATLGYASCATLFCSYHILTSSVIYYWTDTRQHGTYLLNRKRYKRLNRKRYIWPIKFTDSQ